MLAPLEPNTIRQQLSEMPEAGIVEFAVQFAAADQMTAGTPLPLVSWRDGSEFRDWSKGASQLLNNTAW